MNDLEEKLLKLCSRSGFLDRNGFVLVSANEQTVVIKTTVRPEIVNNYGMVHGGVLLNLADNVAGLAAYIDGRHYMTQNCGFQFLANTNHGDVFAAATVLHRGRTVASIRVEITDENGRLLSEGLFSMFHVEREFTLPEKKLD